jgi:hypothetical protein
MINSIIAELNSVIGIRRSDAVNKIPLILTIVNKENNPKSNPNTPNVINFFLDVVDKFNWGKIHNPLDIDNIYKMLDRSDELGEMYFRYLDMFELIVRNFLAENKFKFDDLIYSIKNTIAISDKYNLKRRSLVATEQQIQTLLSDHTWLATVYLLSFTDLSYIIRFDLPLGMATANEG